MSVEFLGLSRGFEITNVISMEEMLILAYGKGIDLKVKLRN